jgi:hypothetical protein
MSLCHQSVGCSSDYISMTARTLTSFSNPTNLAPDPAALLGATQRLRGGSLTEKRAFRLRYFYLLFHCYSSNG